MEIIQHSLFDGKVCYECGLWHPLENYHRHPNTKDGRTTQCKECRKAYTVRNADVARARTRRWRADNPEKYQAQKDRQLRRYQEQHPGCYRIYNKRPSGTGRDLARLAHWNEQNKDKINTWRRVRYPQMRDKQRARKRAWEKANPEKNASQTRRYQARKRGARGTHTYTEWVTLCQRYDSRCVCCGEQKPLTEDHVIPISRGGSDDIDNIQPLCVVCNSRKGTLSTDYRKQFSLTSP
jgi:hypothetical protein